MIALLVLPTGELKLVTFWKKISNTPIFTLNIYKEISKFV